MYKDKTKAKSAIIGTCKYTCMCTLNNQVLRYLGAKLPKGQILNTSYNVEACAAHTKIIPE